jgi:hypothetical protein
MERLIKFFDRNIIMLVLIFIGIYIVFYILNVNIHLIVTLILFSIVFYYLWSTREQEKSVILTNRKNEKFDNKIPSVLNKYDDILNFLYYISDFKQYNEKVYDDLLTNLNDFYSLMEDYQIIQGTKKKLMEDVIFDTKNKILDGLSSLIYSFNNSPVLTKKLNDSIQKLNDILNQNIKKLNIKIDYIDAFNNYL